VPRRFVPKRGDLVWLQFNPQAGHEQAGRRPAMVISPKAYHEKVGLGLFCPVTKHVKGYPFEVVLPHDLKVTGAILSDQIKCLDWRVRQAKYVCPAPRETVEEVLAKIAILVGNEDE